MEKRELTDEQKRARLRNFKKLIDEGKSVREIAEATGWSAPLVYAELKGYVPTVLEEEKEQKDIPELLSPVEEIKPKQEKEKPQGGYHTFKLGEVKEIIQLYGKGVPATKIAHKLGIRVYGIRKVLMAHGMAKPDLRPRKTDIRKGEPVPIVELPKRLKHLQVFKPGQRPPVKNKPSTKTATEATAEKIQGAIDISIEGEKILIQKGNVKITV